MWLLTGSVSLGTWLGIHVRLHASLIVLGGLSLLLPGSLGGLQNAATFIAILFGIVVLHEFGHCLASRWVGGNPNEILLYPLGGLAFADAPRRPWATFVTVAGGPLVNVLICILTAAGLAVIAGTWKVAPWDPMDLNLGFRTWNSTTGYYLWWIFLVSWGLLLFNLLPIYPLDGGQLLQSLLWVKFGYYKSTLFASITGMIGAVLLALYGLMHFSILLMCVAISGFQTCLHMYRQLKANGPWAYEEEAIYSAAYENPDRPRKSSARKLRAAQRQARDVVSRR